MRKTIHHTLQLLMIASATIIPVRCTVVVHSDEHSSATTFFTTKVAPILQRRCLSCHNDIDRKGEFSLQSASSAFADGYVEKGNSADSHLMQMIMPVDGSASMPKDSDPLSAAQLTTIKKWIDEGASWPENQTLTSLSVADLDWWSLRKLTRPTVPTNWNSLPDALPNDRKKQHSTTGSVRTPTAHHSLRIRTPIDAFIQEKLDAKGLVASPEADRRTLARRLFFDLIGLPPSPDDIEEFVNDQTPDAYEALVDRLLGSQHYGERWARHWLDVVHYADTHGYDKDKLRPNAWPYRDYVIRAFNEDKPYSRFAKEQIAGDALWPHTLDGVTATGFIAAGPWDFIGHAEVPETKIDGRIARNLDRDDMVTTTLNTFCSVTVQCARCHNHKFDPVTQEHYYSLQSVFSALDRADRPFDTNPETSKQRAELNRRQQQLTNEKRLLEAAVENAAGKRLQSIDDEIADLEKQNTTQSEKPEFGYHSQIVATPNATKWVQVDLGESLPIDEIRYVGCHDDFAGIGHGFGFPKRYKIEASDDADFTMGIQLIADHTKGDVPNPGTTPQSVRASVKARFVRFTATKLAVRSNDYIFALAELMVLNRNGENVASGKAVTSLDSIQAPVRWQRENLVDGYFFGVGSGATITDRIETLKTERESLLARTVSKKLRTKLDANIALAKQTRIQLEALPKPHMVYAGTIHTGQGAFTGTGAEGGKPRPIHVLHRGNIQSPRNPVGPGTLPIIPDVDWRFELPESHDESERRVALANWITHHDNPLTWRSIVNRVWHYHFGRGIVDSPNDFGRMGKLPSHEKLLDWLAIEFRDGNQRFKALHKTIVMSSVYRQSSAHNSQNADIDGSNEFLWRMNRRRLSAEEIRDAVLHVSGKLNKEMYGPGFQLFLVEHPEHSPHYEYHKHNPDDVKSHRRSIYRFIVRSQPDPFMTALDCADSSQSVAKRDETLTALQALSLLNNKFMLRMAQHFSDRIQRHDVASTVDEAFRQVTGRAPTAEQRAMLTRYATEHGAANMCRVLLNLNEFVFVD